MKWLIVILLLSVCMGCAPKKEAPEGEWVHIGTIRTFYTDEGKCVRMYEADGTCFFFDCDPYESFKE